MTEPQDSTDPSDGSASEAQFGPHRFSAGEGGGSTELRGAEFDVMDLRGARFTDCDLSGVTIRDGWLVGVDISGYIERLTVNGVDVTEFVQAELDRRHPERVQFRTGQSLADLRGVWDTVECLWAEAVERMAKLPATVRSEQVNGEWSFEQTMRHLVFITDAWASRTVLDVPMPYHPLGLPQSWYPRTEAAALGIDLEANPSYDEVLAVRAERVAVMRAILDSLTGESVGRPCLRSPAPGYPDEQRTVLDCVAVVIDEELEHYRFAVRDLTILEARAGR